ncbi:ASCH domain-containing protein [Thermococcus sp. GR7]|nr:MULTISPECIES: ASCH domain-containing protein [Thermococcus]NJE46769.1 ASCH domain-containing protein [Thermococcus sp. GR7]NJE77803.1 ASCH domain-containing protein [Thermococcus sp. GR4]NJF22931.1 ASCH domain-containing protein [Thermococcus sp. GR5]
MAVEVETRKKGLIVREPFATLIVEGKKVWEIRKSRTRVRGEILILNGGKALGKAELVEVLGPFTPEELAEHRDKHLADLEFLRAYSNGRPLYAWVLRNAEKFEKPAKVNIAKGVQVWANVVMKDEQ